MARKHRRFATEERELLSFYAPRPTAWTSGCCARHAGCGFLPEVGAVAPSVAGSATPPLPALGVAPNRTPQLSSPKCYAAISHARLLQQAPSLPPRDDRCNPVGWCPR